MLIWIAAGAGAGILLALALWAWGRAKARTARVMRTARLLSPFILPAFAYPLLRVGEWDAFPRIAAIAVVAVVGSCAFACPLPRSCRRGCWWRDGCGRWARRGRGFWIGRGPGCRLS